MTARVDSVHVSSSHSFSKTPVPAIRLIEGIGVAGDAHAGVTVQHRSRVAADPSQPNLRQVHLIHAELFDLLSAAGHRVGPGELGENITTTDIDLLSLPVGTRLRIGPAELTVTGLRNPCRQINTFQRGLLQQVLRKDANGAVQRLAGVMAVVSRGGAVRPGDRIEQQPPPLPHFPLTRV
ncbi:MOSC domain-containing protein [Flexivirga lutea]